MLRRFVLAASVCAFTALTALPSSAATFGVGGPTIVAQYDGNMPLFQASSWTVTEDGGWTAVWTFNTNHRSMNAVWTNQSTGLRVTANNMRVTQEGDQIIIARPGLGNYVGTINSAGTALAGTMSWSNGHFSAQIGNGGGYHPGNGGGYHPGNGGGYRPGNGGGYQPGDGGYNQGGGSAPMFNANSWFVTEDGGWTATWTFNSNHTLMSGLWTNNETGERVRVNNMSVRQNGHQIIVARPGLGNYVGTLSSDGNSMSGTLSWSSGHFNARVQN